MCVASSVSSMALCEEKRAPKITLMKKDDESEEQRSIIASSAESSKVKIDGKEYQIASIGDRVMAVFMDGLKLIGKYLLLAVASGGVGYFASPVLGCLIGCCGNLYIVYDFYHHKVETNGQTYGKESMKIRTKRLDGEPITWGTVIMDGVGRCFSGLDLLALLVTEHHQGVHNMLAGTVVVEDA